MAFTFGEKWSGEIAKQVHGIRDRMLAKELRDLEWKRLVKRYLYDTYSAKVTYSLSAYSQLQEVINS